GRIAHTIAAGFGAIGLRPSLPLLLAIFVILMGVRTVLGRLQSDAMYLAEQRFETSLRLRLYRAISHASWLYLCRGRASDVTHALSTELARAGQAAFELMLLAADLILTVFYLLIAFRLAPAITALVLVCGALLAVALRGRTREIYAAGAEVSESMNSLFGAMTEQLGNLKLAKAYGAEERNYAMFAALTHSVERAHLVAQRGQAAASAWFELGSAIILGAMLYFAIGRLAVAPAAILILLVMFARVMPRFLSALGRWHSTVNLAPAFGNLIAMEARFAAHAEPPPAADRVAPQLRREIRFANVEFAYTPEALVLRALDLVIPAGAIVAIVGPSGAGKSTIADLAMGLIAPDRGRVTIDGAALEPAALAHWRGQIGYAASDTFLFHGTIGDNLRWARPGATDAELRTALEASAAAEFVAAMPAGLDAIVGDRGVALSQGERQRLAIARAWLRRPRLLVLDEATNSLDSANEARIRSAIETRRGELTVLMIAHRLATIRWADLIYVIEDGKVVEHGDWSTLSARAGGRFRALCEAQTLTG
ncbi:MAG TPA: ABC transporter ATP-binding protein, partial [Candidatus Binataceae bacterium]|nr:ABC transporter ATP-binding protein [Candidatus Binataceae bacterium]